MLFKCGQFIIIVDISFYYIKKTKCNLIINVALWIKYIMMCVSDTLPIMALQPSARVLFIYNKKKLYIVVLSLELGRNKNTIESGKRSI